MSNREVIRSAQAVVGQTVRGKWRLDALLGVGGSGAVYAATHRNGKRGALKILRADLAYDMELRERFLREGYVANQVGHPGVVAMLDDDIDDDGSAFLVMELLQGSTLELLHQRRTSMPLREVLRIAESVLDVLAAAHARGIVHGDIKPANVFLTSANDVKLLDFGIARMSAMEERTEVSLGDALGTPAYMAPEQARGESVDGRTDLWSVGALMFALITGEKPREGENAAEDLVLARAEPMRKLAGMAPQLSRELAQVVDRALAFDPASRWPNAVTMQQALRLALLLEQASGPANEGVRVPVALAPNRGAHPAVDAFRILRGPRSVRPGARGGPSTPTPVSVERLSTLPPESTTAHRLAFAASVPPRSHRAPRASRARVASVLSAALLALTMGLGFLFTRPFLGQPASAAGLAAPLNDAGPLDARGGR